MLVEIGTKSNDVIMIRSLLTHIGYSDEKTQNKNSKADSALMYYVGLFQKDNNLTVDFVAGKNTLKKIQEKLSNLNFDDSSSGKYSGGENSKKSFADMGCDRKIPRKYLLPNHSSRKLYGDPDNVRLIRMGLPCPMKLAWDVKKQVNSISMNLMCADSFKAAWSEICKVYSPAERSKYGIDLYAGCYNRRKIRGGNVLSSHSWGTAIDINSLGNPMGAVVSTTHLYKYPLVAFADIMVKHGFYTLSHDLMHWQYLPRKFR